MASDSTNPPFCPFQAQAELELLHLVLQTDAPYPWNPAEPGADAYFDDLEQEVIAGGWTAEEIATQGQILSATFDRMWSTVLPVTQQDGMGRVTADLFQKFAAQVPQHFLEKIVQQARQVLSLNLSLADQLVMCVQDLLPSWGEEDLQVLARPFAHAMRGVETEMLQGAFKSVRCADWNELSSLEQARLSLAIARYTLAQLPPDAPENS